METLLVKIDKELKKLFQIKVITEEKKMNEVIAMLIKKYIEE